MQIVWSSNLLNHALCDNTTGGPSELYFVAFSVGVSVFKRQLMPQKRRIRH